MHICIVCVYTWVHASMCICMYVYMYACVHACMYICMHVCIHVCIYVIFKLSFERYGVGIVLVWRGNCPVGIVRAGNVRSSADMIFVSARRLEVFEDLHYIYVNGD